MQIEIEKKFNLNKHDYEIIRKNADFIGSIEIKDYYLDKDMILTKNKYFLRLRNGRYELKVINFNPETKTAISEEYNNEDDVYNKLKNDLNINVDDCTGIIFIHTKREKYKYNYKGYDINIDVEEYQYGARYELEIIYQEENIENREKIEIELNNILDDLVKEWKLDAIQDENTSKVINCAMHQNIEMYEILTEINI